MNALFWNVDTQYDFMRTEGAYKGKLGIPGAEAIEGNLEHLTNLAAAHGTKVVNTADWHTPNSKELSATPDYRITFPEHCMQGTFGAEFVVATKPKDPYVIDWQQATYDSARVAASREIVLYKDHFDIFQGNPHADAVLADLKPTRAIMYGVATNVFVDYAVMGLRERGVEVIVPLDAIKELPGLPLEATLRKWQAAGAVLITTKEVPNYLG